MRSLDEGVDIHSLATCYYMPEVGSFRRELRVVAWRGTEHALRRRLINQVCRDKSSKFIESYVCHILSHLNDLSLGSSQFTRPFI